MSKDLEYLGVRETIKKRLTKPDINAVFFMIAGIFGAIHQYNTGNIPVLILMVGITLLGRVSLAKYDIQRTLKREIEMVSNGN